ncbi:hypothetical protein J6590_026089 [Homalodisca vitripennis]|nr:hypothetical protein J6590_026089 [Homalodisca vitripennis]
MSPRVISAIRPHPVCCRQPATFRCLSYPAIFLHAVITNSELLRRSVPGKMPEAQLETRWLDKTYPQRAISLGVRGNVEVEGNPSPLSHEHSKSRASFLPTLQKHSSLYSDSTL